MELENKLSKLFAETFNISEEKITPNLKPDSLPEWDSLGQLRLMMNIESEFQISFHIDDIKELNSYEKILRTIQEKKS